MLKWQGKLVVRCFRGWSELIKRVKREKKRTNVVKEGEWQDFLRDARTVVTTPKAAKGGGRSKGGGRVSKAFFSDDGVDDEDEKNKEVGYGELEELGHLSPHTIRNLSTVDLQTELVKRGLPSAGSKPALIARLTACQDFLSPRSTKAAYRANHWREEREDIVGEQIEGYAKEVMEEGRRGRGGQGRRRRGYD